MSDNELNVAVIRALATRGHGIPSESAIRLVDEVERLREGLRMANDDIGAWRRAVVAVKSEVVRMRAENERLAEELRWADTELAERRGEDNP